MLPLSLTLYGSLARSHLPELSAAAAAGAFSAGRACAAHNYTPIAIWSRRAKRFTHSPGRPPVNQRQCNSALSAAASLLARRCWRVVAVAAAEMQLRARRVLLARSLSVSTRTGKASLAQLRLRRASDCPTDCAPVRRVTVARTNAHKRTSGQQCDNGADDAPTSFDFNGLAANTICSCCRRRRRNARCILLGGQRAPSK